MITTTAKRYTLERIRSRLGLSQCKLSEMANVSIGAIRSIENGGYYKTNVEVAERISRALGMNIDQIDWPRGLSNRGRPPGTGKEIEITQHPTQPIYCPRCQLEYPLSWHPGEACDNCS